MAYEVDYLAVGEGERSADAIALRFADSVSGNAGVVVIDGGTKESGISLVELIRSRYGRNQVDVVLCTHPDADHASGLTVVLEEMQVGHLLMHLPWEHATAMKDLFKGARVTAGGLERKLTRSLRHASTLEDLARKKGVPIYEPFAGTSAFGGVLRVLGPTEDYYHRLVASFDCTPEPKRGLMEEIERVLAEAVEWIDDNPFVNLLDDVDRTSPENNSSAIVLFSIDGHNLLFTGDAGITALCAAADYADALGVDLSQLTFLDVPHHGSRRNAGRTAYQRIRAKTAYISAAKNSDKHPSKKVTNALLKAGTQLVGKTCGRNIWFHNQAPARPDYALLVTEPFHGRVEQ